MPFGRLYIFVEGNDDERFFLSVIVPLFAKYYSNVEVLKYAQWKKKKVNMFIQSIETLRFDYIFVRDFDEASSIKDKIKEIVERYDALNTEAVNIVVAEIESWYLAGISNTDSDKIRISRFTNTDSIVKEDFNNIFNGIFRSRIDFMKELLKAFSLKTAMNKNASFSFFMDKYNLYEEERN